MDLHTAAVFVTICAPFVLASLWAIVDASQREFGSLQQKMAWMFVAAVPFFGFVVYLIFGMRKGRKEDDE